MKLPSIIWLPIFLMIFCSLSAVAELTTEENVDYYYIEGDSDSALRYEMNQKGPGGFDAYTKWSVKWNFRFYSQNNQCRITSVQVSLSTTFTLPEWVNYDQASSSLKRKWDRYYDALKAHERGHQDFGLKTAREIERGIGNLPPENNCQTLETKANQLGNQTLKKYTHLEKKYDIDTKHGMLHGARFP